MNLLIFKAGEYPQGSWPIERTRKMVESYDPINNIEAPGVVGHMDNGLVERQENELAHAWVKSLSITEAGEVYADIPNEEISPQLKGWLADHNLRYVSAELGEYDKLPAPNAGAPYLLRLAFLGRSIPQIPTTKIPALFKRMLFAVGFGKGEPETIDGVRVVQFCRKIDASAIEEIRADLAAHKEPQKQEPTQAAFSGSLVKQNSIKEVPMTEKELQDENARLKAENAQIRSDLSSRDTKIAEFEKKVTAQTEEQNKKAAEAYFGALRDKGRLTPVQFEAAVKLDVGMTTENRAIYRSLFGESMKPVVHIGVDHVVTPDRAKSEAGEAAGDLVTRVNAFAKKGGISYQEAAKRLNEEHPELFMKEAR
jgi:hypothetical protein